jgi:serine/threonine protein kinase
MMCSNGTTLNSRRRARPGERLAKDVASKKQQREQLPHLVTASLSASDRSEGDIDDSLRSSSELSQTALDDLHRRICPVTGVYREIGDDYCLSSTVLGQGYYGCVRECEHRATGRVYACKSIDKSRVRRLDHLRREIYLLRKMRHERIMSTVDCYEDETFVHIVTERYTGGELFDRIADETTATGCFDEKKAARVIKSLLEAVAYLHSNDIVHRDIKPENVLFVNSSDDSPVKLIDFGLSRRHKRGEAPMTNPVGTAYYMAPELLNGSYDKSCDVWSIGTIAYICLCGYPPFNGEEDPDIFEAIKKGELAFPSAAWGEKSDDVKNFIKALLDKTPGKRPSAAEALEHPWIKGNTCDEGATQHDDIMARIQALRTTISKFKKSMQH